MMRPSRDFKHMFSTQLLYAVLERDINAVEQFLKKGGEANVVSRINGHTAVGMAAALGEPKILRLLIQFCDEQPTQICSLETDTIENTPEGMDELEWEDEFPSDDADSSNSNAEIDELTTLYHYYAKTLEVTGSILNSIKAGLYAKDKRKDDPHVPDENLMTPLHYAAAYGHSTCVDILLASGCKLNLENVDGFTPLHFAAKFYDITNKLLENGADPSLHTLRRNETALHRAIKFQNIQVVELLLKHTRCNIDALNSDDRTPLICAVRENAWHIAMLLLDHKPLVNLADKKGRTALYYAVTRNNVDVARRLLNCRARRLPEHYLLHNCVRLNLKEMIELLIKHGDSLSIQNGDGLTPIMYAVENQNAEMLEYLLQKNANIKSACTNEFCYLGNELYLAVDRTQRLEDFKSLAKVLFAYTNTSLTDPIDECCCMELLSSENLLFTPLAHAIESNKLSFAEYMIKEGIDAKFACSEHSMMQLSLLHREPGVLEFTRFLIYSGFEAKHRTIPRLYTWSPEQVNYELEVLELIKNPLPLKALSRIVIRRCLTQHPFGAHSSQPMPLESFMLNRIKKLGLPNSLQTYLHDFPDCSMKLSSVIK